MNSNGEHFIDSLKASSFIIKGTQLGSLRSRLHPLRSKWRPSQYRQWLTANIRLGGTPKSCFTLQANISRLGRFTVQGSGFSRSCLRRLPSWEGWHSGSVVPPAQAPTLNFTKSGWWNINHNRPDLIRTLLGQHDQGLKLRSDCNQYHTEQLPPPPFRCRGTKRD